MPRMRQVMASETILSRENVDIRDGKSCVYKVSCDVGTQTEPYELTKLVAAILQKRIMDIQTFDSTELQHKLKKVEEENRNLKKRELILEKRLVQLEEQQIPTCDKEPSPKKMRPTLDQSCSENILENTQVTSNELQIDFCPSLFKPANQKKTSANSVQKEKLPVPTQMVPPMPPKTINPKQTEILGAKTITTFATNTEVSPKTTIKIQTDPVQLRPRPELPRFIHPQPLSMQILSPSTNPGQYIRLPQPHSQATFMSKNGHVFRQVFSGPPPNLNIFDYRPLSRSAMFSHFQVQRPPPQRTYTIETPQLQPVQNNNLVAETTLLKTQRPPPPYNETVPIVALPHLTAGITSDSTNIILTWDCYNGTKQFQCNVDWYILFAYHTLDLRTPPPNKISEWKRIGAIKILPLPIACTLTQTFDGHNYFFAVAAVDKNGVVGELSNACALKVTL